ncbi:hypothetical protein K466DRAFT_120724 [Polyporus arcularius HHB13444]|uniref:Uncharacterized protein n=1 Tax=Polyporus arcularius HHB13444 TaxID=1314778 RepID=A0A5C3PUE0_9APHY|nr:hypothetical protein K466DRAFT_120724 [Polyporus arcularius HHB13444]
MGTRTPRIHWASLGLPTMSHIVIHDVRDSRPSPASRTTGETANPSCPCRAAVNVSQRSSSILLVFTTPHPLMRSGSGLSGSGSRPLNESQGQTVQPLSWRHQLTVRMTARKLQLFGASTHLGQTRRTAHPSACLPNSYAILKAASKPVSSADTRPVGTLAAALPRRDTLGPDIRASGASPTARLPRYLASLHHYCTRTRPCSPSPVCLLSRRVPCWRCSRIRTSPSRSRGGLHVWAYRGVRLSGARGMRSGRAEREVPGCL